MIAIRGISKQCIPSVPDNDKAHAVYVGERRRPSLLYSYNPLKQQEVSTRHGSVFQAIVTS